MEQKFYLQNFIMRSQMDVNFKWLNQFHNQDLLFPESPENMISIIIFFGEAQTLAERREYITMSSGNSLFWHRYWITVCRYNNNIFLCRRLSNSLIFSSVFSCRFLLHAQHLFIQHDRPATSSIRFYCLPLLSTIIVSLLLSNCLPVGLSVDFHKYFHFMGCMFTIWFWIGCFAVYVLHSRLTEKAKNCYLVTLTAFSRVGPSSANKYDFLLCTIPKEKETHKNHF